MQSVKSCKKKTTITEVAYISIIINVILSAFKLIAGFFGRSGAMVSDGFHSLSDVLSSFVVIIGVKIAQKAPDKDHPYGHERFECVAALVLSILLLITGVLIGRSALEQIRTNSFDTQTPSLLALIAAIVSIAVKEGMYWFTRHYAKLYSSGALMADAWHHRSDSLSSIGALIGIAGARMGFPILEPLASLIICVFIVKAAYDIFRDAIMKMVDRSCNPDTEKEICDCAREVDGVIDVLSIQTRVFGNRIYVDIEITADGIIPLSQSDEIAQSVHAAIEKKFPTIKHIAVITRPEISG